MPGNGPKDIASAPLLNLWMCFAVHQHSCVNTMLVWKAAVFIYSGCLSDAKEILQGNICYVCAYCCLTILVEVYTSSLIRMSSWYVPALPVSTQWTMKRCMAYSLLTTLHVVDRALITIQKLPGVALQSESILNLRHSLTRVPTVLSRAVA